MCWSSKCFGEIKKKKWHADILSVGPAKEDDDVKKDEKKELDETEKVAELIKVYKNYNPYIPHYYHVHSNIYNFYKNLYIILWDIMC